MVLHPRFGYSDGSELSLCARMLMLSCSEKGSSVNKEHEEQELPVHLLKIKGWVS